MLQAVFFFAVRHAGGHRMYFWCKHYLQHEAVTDFCFAAYYLWAAVGFDKDLKKLTYLEGLAFVHF